MSSPPPGPGGYPHGDPLSEAPTRRLTPPPAGVRPPVLPGPYAGGPQYPPPAGYPAGGAYPPPLPTVPGGRGDAPA